MENFFFFLKLECGCFKMSGISTNATTLLISVGRHDSESHAMSLPNVIGNWSPDQAVIFTKNGTEATLTTEQVHNGKLSLMKTLKMGNSVYPYFQGSIASLLKCCNLGFYVKKRKLAGQALQCKVPAPVKLQ